MLLPPCLLAVLSSMGQSSVWFDINNCLSIKDLAYGFGEEDLPPEAMPVSVEANDRMDSQSRARARASSSINDLSLGKMVSAEKQPLVSSLARAPDLLPRRLAPEFQVPVTSGITVRAEQSSYPQRRIRRPVVRAPVNALGILQEKNIV